MRQHRRLALEAGGEGGGVGEGAAHDLDRDASPQGGVGGGEDLAHAADADDSVGRALRESEALLATGLRAIDPHARVIGEEAYASDPTLLDDIGTGRLWLVDPLDGTNNFAAGRTPFGMIVALVEDGVVRILNVEESPSKAEASGAEAILKVL